MLAINQETQRRLSESLYLYYDAVKYGDLKSLSDIMTEESYLMTLESIGFKRAFKDKEFKKLLNNMHNDKYSLDRVEKILSKDLADAPSKHNVEIVEFEPNGSERVTLHYSVDSKSKKFYFSSASGEWKIDYKAGRKVV